MRHLLIIILLFCCISTDAQHALRIVELNTENLFDCQHDTLRNDYEFLPSSTHHWTPQRYWTKLKHIAQEISTCGVDSEAINPPDIIGLCEVENDSVLFDLTHRSNLRIARYEYVMTDSPDRRGIDVALLYSPLSFSLIGSHSIRVDTIGGMKPTRDILYASGRIITGDTVHVMVVHAPSRSGGERHSRPFRMVVAKKIAATIDSIRGVQTDAKIIVMGDFNDYASNASVRLITAHGMANVSAGAHGSHGARGTYRYHGLWGSLDQMFVSRNIAGKVINCVVVDEPFLLKEDERYGGVQPRRNYLGPRYMEGFSDHLPLKMTIKID